MNSIHILTIDFKELHKIVIYSLLILIIACYIRQPNFVKSDTRKKKHQKINIKTKTKSETKRRRTGILFRRIPVETSYLIIIPSLIGDRVVSEAIHFDVAIDVQLLIAQFLVAWNGIVVGEAASRIVTLFLTLGLGCGSHRSTAR